MIFPMNFNVFALSFSKALSRGLKNKIRESCQDFDLLKMFSDRELALFCEKSKRPPFEGRDFLFSKAEKVLKECVEKQIEVVCAKSEQMPARLAEIYHSPDVLYVLGGKKSIFFSSDFSSTEPYVRKNLSVVGTRLPERFVECFCEGLSRTATENGFVVISGLAMGVDAYAHKGALSSGRTVGVLGCGIDLVYPWCNRHLYSSILEFGGSIVSEYGPGEKSQRYYFPERNRIISGMSDYVLVAQASKKSGALITANYAIEQNRELFVFEGLMGHDSFEGNRSLAEQGATIVRSVKDFEYIFMNISDLKNQQNDSSEKPESIKKFVPSKSVFLGFLGQVPKTVPEISSALKLPVEEVSRWLMRMELEGLVTETSGMRYFSVQ